MGETRNEELDYLDWTRKLSERLQVVHTCLIDKRKISEQDYDVMETLFRVWSDGRIPFYHKVIDGVDDNSTQQMLF